MTDQLQTSNTRAMVLQLLSSRGKSRPVFGCKGSGISLNWSITDEVTTDNTTTYFSGPLRICRAKIGLCDVTDRVTVTTGRRRLLFFFLMQRDTMVDITASVGCPNSMAFHSQFPNSQSDSQCPHLILYTAYCTPLSIT